MIQQKKRALIRCRSLFLRLFLIDNILLKLAGEMSLQSIEQRLHAIESEDDEDRDGQVELVRNGYWVLAVYEGDGEKGEGAADGYG